MNQSDLKAWVKAHGLTRAELVNQVNLGRAKPLSAAAINKWLDDSSRKPPAWLDALLPVIEARLASPERAVIFTVLLALSEDEAKALRRTARRAHQTPEKFLSLCARLGFESECGLI